MQKKESFSGYDNLNTDRKIALTQADFVSQAKPLLTWWVIAFKNIVMHDFQTLIRYLGKDHFHNYYYLVVIIIAIFSIKNVMVKSNSYFQCMCVCVYSLPP